MRHETDSLLSGRLGNLLYQTGLDFLAILLLCQVLVSSSAEVVFQDYFNQPAGNITNNVPWIDVKGNGWQTGGAASQLLLDGSGHVYNAAASAGTAAGVPLIPIGPHGSLTASASVKLPANSAEWVGLGFASSNRFLAETGSGSGPWLQVLGNGTMILYGGAGLNNAATVANAFTNTGNPVQTFLTCDKFHATASAGTIGNDGTNFIFNQWPLTNSAGAIAPNYLVLQMSTNLTMPAARWATAVAVDWFPRPPPMSRRRCRCNKPILLAHRAPMTLGSFKTRSTPFIIPPRRRKSALTLARLMSSPTAR